MKNNKIKIKHIVSYAGHSITANGKVTFTLKAMYANLTNTIQLMQLLNYDLDIKARINKQVVLLGVFKIDKIIIDGDGESKIKFIGISDYIELDNLNNLPLQNENESEFQILLEGELEE